MNSLEEMFEPIKRSLMKKPGVSDKAMFGAHGLSVGGKFFVMTYKGAMVTKLPAERVEELIRTGVGNPWDPGHGRTMKEWVAFPPGKGDWSALAEEAMEFVQSNKVPKAGAAKKKTKNVPVRKPAGKKKAVKKKPAKKKVVKRTAGKRGAKKSAGRKSAKKKRRR